MEAVFVALPIPMSVLLLQRFLTWWNKDPDLSTHEENPVLSSIVDWKTSEPSSPSIFVKIDIGFLKSCLLDCQKGHGNHCEPHPDPSSGRPILLIDVYDGCITQSGETDHYVALSYVWGQTSLLKCTTRNIDELKTPGALINGKLSKSIPKTIRDAIELVRLLGERFLWVDCLCIVQDLESIKQGQILAMGGIFERAVLTLVAAQGVDPNFGLVFPADLIRRGVVELHMAPLVAKTKRILLVAKKWRAKWLPGRSGAHQRARNKDEILKSSLDTSVWAQRGWTLQELLFSHRIMAFAEDGIYWECHCRIRHSKFSGRSILTHALEDDRIDKTRPFHDTSWPDLETYAFTIQDYNKRRLTFPGDILRAFSGVTSALHQQFLDGFHFGLPRMFFDVTLLWQPDKPLHRRRGEQQEQYSTALPSWSWIGWEGDLDLSLWASGYDYVLTRRTRNQSFPSTSVRTRSIVQWSSSGRLIQNPWPSTNWGWTQQGRVWQHSTDPHTDFQYPVPILKPSDITYDSLSTSSLLIGSVRRGWFKFGPVIRSSMRCVSRELRGSNNQFSGCLRLNHGITCHEDHVANTCFETGRTCEFIAISTGRARNADDETELLEEWHHPSRPREGEFYEYYNVLWIEWEGKIAYRKALGRIWKDTWERDAGEEIKITLG
jgi:Heterokaryon incompatibility protein (HET)